MGPPPPAEKICNPKPLTPDPGTPPLAKKISNPKPPAPNPRPPPADPGKITNPNPQLLLLSVCWCCCRRQTGKPALPAMKNMRKNGNPNLKCAEQWENMRGTMGILMKNMRDNENPNEKNVRNNRDPNEKYAG